MPKSPEVRLVNADYAKEIVRRARAYTTNYPTPRPLNWPKAQKIEWLEANPIRESTDILFLREEVSQVKGILERSLEVERRERELLGLTGVTRGGRHWWTNVPYLRLILCLTQDDIKFAFLRRADAQSRQELDARNSQNR